MIITRLCREIIDRVARAYNYHLVYDGPRVARSADTQRVIWLAHYKGHGFYCIKNTVIADFILTGQGWDNAMGAMLTSSLARKKGRVVVEVGANIGATLVPRCADFPDVSFHLFEPVPAFYELLVRNKESFSATNACLHNVGIGDKDNDVMKITCDLGNGGMSIADGPPIDAVNVRSRTLDALFPSEDIAFVKIDVDGYEAKVLSGAEKLLKRCQPDVFMEFYPELMRSNGVKPEEVLERLLSVGLCHFTVYTNTGQLLRSTDSIADVLQIAENNRPYVDLLVSDVAL